MGDKVDSGSHVSERISMLEQRNELLAKELSSFSDNDGKYDSFGDGDATLIDLLILPIWSMRWWVLGGVTFFTMVSCLIAFSLNREYRSTAILAPVSASGMGGISRLTQQFGGIASLAGINLPSGGGEDKTTIAIEILKTWGFLEKFILSNELEEEVFAVYGWDRSQNELLIDSDLYDVKTKKWVREVDEEAGETPRPSSWELYEALKERVFVSQNKSTGFVSVTVEHFSPFLAKEWVDLLVKDINAHIKEQDKIEARKSIAFLKKQIAETNVSDMQSVFYQLIEEQTKTLMLTEVSQEYVLKTISPAKVPEKPSKPKKVLIVFFGVILGTIFSMFLSLAIYYLRLVKSNSGEVNE